MKESQHPDTFPGLRIGEVILRTGRYGQMKQWYRKVLAAEPYFEHVPVETPEAEGSASKQRWATQFRLCFFRLVLDHPYQQVVGIFDVPGTEGSAPSRAGLHHIQLGDRSPVIMARRHTKLKALGIVPFRAVDHGPTTSFYYMDPDENMVEIAAPNFADVANFLSAVQAPDYINNPFGHPVNPDEMAALLGWPLACSVAAKKASSSRSG